jgi:hypothetical protein
VADCRHAQHTSLSVCPCFACWSRVTVPVWYSLSSSASTSFAGGADGWLRVAEKRMEEVLRNDV